MNDDDRGWLFNVSASTPSGATVQDLNVSRYSAVGIVRDALREGATKVTVVRTTETR